MKEPLKFASGLALCLCLLGQTALAQENTQTMPSTLTVSGDGKALAEPDMATITLGVVAENRQADIAVREMSQQMAGVLDRLEASGIAPRDMQSSGLSVSPRWSNNNSSEGKPPRIETFAASSRITVRVRDLDQLGGLLDAVVQDGANSFDGLTFGLQEPQPKQDEARRIAVAEAARKAALYAEAAGVGLGPILSINETGSPEPRMMRAEMASFAADSGVPVAAGELNLTASVTITYALDTAD